MDRVVLTSFMIFAFLSSAVPVGAGGSGQGRDVAAINVLIDPSEPLPGEASVVGVTVANLGNARLQGVPVKLLVNGSQVGSTKYVDLGGGGATVVLFDWAPPTAGSYSLVGEVGPIQGESDQANNQAFLTVNVAEEESSEDDEEELPDESITENTDAIKETISQEGATGSSGEDEAAPAGLQEEGEEDDDEEGRDVAVVGISATPREPLPGENVQIRLVVGNRGTAVLRRIPVKLLVDGSQVGSTSIERLRRGEQAALTFQWTPENYGYYSLIGVAGPVEGEEKNQINNFASAIVSIPLIKTIHIQDQAITTSKLADAAVTVAKIANLAVTTEKIAENAVDASRLALDEQSMYKISGGFSYLVPASPGRDFTQRGGLVAVDQATRSIYFRIREPTADNYNIDLSHNLNLYFNWADITRLALRSDGSIDYSGGLYQGGVRGIPTDDIRDNAVTENKIAENAVTNRQIADNSISGAKLLDLSITGNKIADATIAASKLDFNVNKFLNVADNTGAIQFSATSVEDNIQFMGGGATTVIFDSTYKRVIISSPTVAPGVTSITAENGLTASPNPITGTGYIGIAPGGVTASRIQDGAVNVYKLATEVEQRLLGEGRVTSTHVQDGAITNADISDSTAFVSVQNAAGAEQFAVTDGSRGLRFQGTGAVGISFDPTTHRVTINAEPTINNYYSYPYYDYRSYPTYYYGPRLYNVSGQPRVDYLGAEGGLAQRESGGVGYFGIADGGVTTSKLADGAVTSAKILNDTITAADIAADAVGSSEIAAGAVGSSEIATGAVTTEKIWDGAVEFPKLDFIQGSTTLAPGGTDYLKYAEFDWGKSKWLYRSLPVFWGRPTSTWGEVWNLSDWGTSFYKGPYWYSTEYWIIKNITGGYRKIFRVILSGWSGEGEKTGFFLTYLENSGEITTVTKLSGELPLQALELPEDSGLGVLRLDGYVSREGILNAPWNYTVNLKTRVVEEKNE